MSCGIPFARGLLDSSARIRLLDPQGEDTSVQVDVLNRWTDGSVRWALIDFAATIMRQDERWSLLVERSDGVPAAPPLARVDDSGRVIVRSVGMEYLVAGRDTQLQIRRSDGGVLDAGRVEIHDDRGDAHRVSFSRPLLETAGPIRSTVVLDGQVSLDGRVLRVRSRLHFFHSTPAVRLELTLHNPARAEHPGNFWELGDAGSVLFRGITVAFAPSGPGPQLLRVSEKPGVAPRPLRLPFDLHQESSGGEHWASPVHRNREGRIPLRFRGYSLTSADGCAEGLRAEPLIDLSTASGRVSAFLHGFWQDFPSALSVTARGELIISPFPTGCDDLHELQGGECKTRSMTLCFEDDLVTPVPLEWARRPCWARAEPQHYCATGVMPFVTVAGDPRHDVLLQEGLAGPASFEQKRELIDEYGWRNFGDLYADHEAAFTGGPAPFVSHYNNQYDAVAGFARQFMRTGDRRWWDLMNDLARHVADIDVYHTTEDKAAYNGGLFWHSFHYVDAGRSAHRSYPHAPGVPGGGPSAEHNYSTGLALHYFLTGWIPSRDAALSLSEWVLAMDDGERTPFRWLAGGATGLASASGSPGYHGPGRGGGNSIRALLTGFEISRRRVYLNKAEELIRRCISPFDDLEALRLLDAERRWYYTVFLESLGVYLSCKTELDEVDDQYAYARESLLHYARWMCEHEYPYLDRPEILEYPTETWSAQDVRKSDVFALAALCSAGEQRAAFLRHSRRFADDVLTRLPAMPTHKYTRPMVLLLTRGYVLPWLEHHPDASLPGPDRPLPRVRPVEFRPQKFRALRRATVAAGLFGAAIVLLLARLVLW